MTRGFVTLAVGKEKYYKLAVNLLKSYKYHTKEAMPFAIFADKNNEYTSLFDKVIILDEPTCSYMDKIELLNNPPYDENIFIDADCLAYSDLNEYWLYCSNIIGGTRCFGKALSLNSHDGWFELEGIGDYKNCIRFIPQMHGGVIYFRKDELTEKIYKSACKISLEYEKYKFKYFDKPADEPILALSMAINNCHPIELPLEKAKRVFVFYPTAKKIKQN